MRDPTNRASGNAEAIEFGTRLFFDQRLSGDGKVACASCHVPERNWTDNRSRGAATAEVDRNTPTLVNLVGKRGKISIPNAAEAGKLFARLDGWLEGRKYVAGGHLTMGDIPVGATAYRWLEIIGIERPELPAVRAWRDRLAARPAFRQHVMLPLS